MKKAILRNYARLIAVTGANVKKGQEVLIQAELDQPEFVKMLVEECYRAGAKTVRVEWSYQPITKVQYRKRSLRTLCRVEDWEVEKLRREAKVLPARIYLLSEDPDGLRGVNNEKIAKSGQARMKVIKPIRDQMENKYQWCIAAVPGAAWAKKVFPDLPKSRAIEELWRAILSAARVDGDAVAAWAAHNADLEARCHYLNDLGIRTLEYTSKNGTHLTVGMMEEGCFLGGGEYTLGGNRFYNPNIPTEEVFITPKRGEAEGIVYATKPLSCQGQLVEDFSIRFEEGKAVEVHAAKNEEALKKLLEMDEGAAYLGECALVPENSPISRSGLLFYNTLFDENAACHLALGMGFSNCVKSYEQYTLEECRALGVNDSMIHEDFMIGTEDLSIIAHTRDGRQVEIFRDGNWAF